MNRDSEPKGFKQLEFNDKDLIMFTITDLRLEKSKEQVHMVISLKRKIQTELLTTYLPTLLLLIIIIIMIIMSESVNDQCLWTAKHVLLRKRCKKTEKKLTNVSLYVCMSAGNSEMLVFLSVFFPNNAHFSSF